MVEEPQLEKIERSINTLYNIADNWSVESEQGSIDQFNIESKSIVNKIQRTIYRSLESLENIDLENVTEDSWPQEMMNLSNTRDSSDQTEINHLQTLADIAQRVFSAQTKANQLFEEESHIIVTDEEVKSELNVALSLVQQIRSSVSDKVTRNAKSYL